MSRSLKSGCNDVFTHREERAGKNGLRICPINEDLASANTWGTPKISRFTGRAHHHDA
jgi:hypothetical protein